MLLSNSLQATFLVYETICSILPILLIIVVLSFTIVELFQKDNPNKLKKVFLGLTTMAIFVILFVSAYKYGRAINTIETNNDFPDYLGLLYLGIELTVGVMYFGIRKLFDMVKKD